MQSGGSSRIGLPELVRHGRSRGRMSDMSLSSTPGATYLECGFFSLERATPSGHRLPQASPLRLYRPNRGRLPYPECGPETWSCQAAYT
jgi:hypothetical protein